MRKGEGFWLNPSSMCLVSYVMTVEVEWLVFSGAILGGKCEKRTLSLILERVQS